LFSRCNRAVSTAVRTASTSGLGRAWRCACTAVSVATRRASKEAVDVPGWEKRTAGEEEVERIVICVLPERGSLEVTRCGEEFGYRSRALERACWERKFLVGISAGVEARSGDGDCGGDSEVYGVGVSKNILDVERVVVVGE